MVRRAKLFCHQNAISAFYKLPSLVVGVKSQLLKHVVDTVYTVSNLLRMRSNA